MVTSCATMNKTKQTRTLSEKNLPGTGITRLTTNRNENNTGNAGLAPDPVPNRMIHTTSNTNGVTSSK